MSGRNFWTVMAAVSAFSAVGSFAQPNAPTTPDLPCTTAEGAEEVAIPAEDGFVKIFNGVDMKGWWNNCRTEDAASDRANGGILRADPANQAIYTQQRQNGGGSMLTSNKKWGNHEIIVELWPTFGNDAGLFHRTTAAGKGYQTVIDYKPNNCIGGSYPQEMESVGSLFYNCSYFFGNSGTELKGGTGNANVNRATFNWANMWDPAGWNEMRVKIYGNPPKHQAFLRKVGVTEWTMVTDVTWPQAYANVVGTSGFLAFQIHYGNYWNKSGKGNWYRNIRVRPLEANGNPVPTKVGMVRSAKQDVFSATGSALTGWLEKDFHVTVRDLRGKVLESFPAKAGTLNHTFSTAVPKGMLVVELKSGAEVRTSRVLPL
jgi:hypothetical protein